MSSSDIPLPRIIPFAPILKSSLEMLFKSSIGSLSVQSASLLAVLWLQLCLLSARRFAMTYLRARVLLVNIPFSVVSLSFQISSPRDCWPAIILSLALLARLVSPNTDLRILC